MKSLRDYYADWEGWSCMVMTDENGNITDDDEKGETCLEVIENDSGSLREHLISKHKMNKEEVRKMEL